MLQQKEPWYESTTSPPQFRSHLQSIGVHVNEPPGVVYNLCVPQKFRWLHVVIQAYLRYWDHSGKSPFVCEPRNETVAAFVHAHGASAAVCNAIARLLRPMTARRGRPRRWKAPGTLASALGPNFFSELDRCSEVSPSTSSGIKS